jgi:hypothetical protein
MAWKPIEDHKIRHCWVHDDDGDECKGEREVHVSPSFYADSGIPCCGECGSNFVYAGTEIDDGALPGIVIHGKKLARRLVVKG